MKQAQTHLGLLCLMAVLVVGGCSEGAPGQRQTDARGHPVRWNPDCIALLSAPLWRFDFDESVELPIPEQAFAEHLQRVGTRYEMFGEGTRFGPGVFTPLRRRDLSAEDMLRMFQIYMGFNDECDLQENYHAYVNHDEEVFYIENRFQYRPYID